MMTAHQSFAESVFRLMEREPVYDKAAESLFRTLTENFINIQFIYSDSTQKNALIFLLVSYQEENDFAKKFQFLMKKYPEWKLEFGPYKKLEDWAVLISNNEKLLSKIEKKYQINFPSKIYDLKMRSQIIDNYLADKKKLKKSNSMESYYIYFYKFFSQISHLTMPGLNRFLIKNSVGEYQLIVDGDNSSINRILTITYQIYYVVLRFFCKEFKIFNKNEFAVFDQYSKKLKH